VTRPFSEFARFRPLRGHDRASRLSSGRDTCFVNIIGPHRTPMVHLRLAAGNQLVGWSAGEWACQQLPGWPGCRHSPQASGPRLVLLPVRGRQNVKAQRLGLGPCRLSGQGWFIDWRCPRRRSRGRRRRTPPVPTFSESHEPRQGRLPAPRPDACHLGVLPRRRRSASRVPGCRGDRRLRHCRNSRSAKGRRACSRMARPWATSSSHPSGQPL